MKTLKRILVLAAAVVAIGYAGQAFAAEASSSQIIFGLVNAERLATSTPALAWNDTLAAAAQLKLDDMIAKKYFAHTDPNNASSTPWVWFKQAGYLYRDAGENLAGPERDSFWNITGYFQSEKDIVSAWMNSPGHRANILKGAYTETGIAVSESEHIVVELFGTQPILATSTAAASLPSSTRNPGTAAANLPKHR